MDNQELRRQKIIAKAKLDELKMRLSYGDDVAEAVAAQEKIWIALNKYSPMTVTKDLSNLEVDTNIGGVIKVYEIKAKDIDPLAKEFQGAIDPELIRLSNELTEIDNRKDQKINELQSLDRKKNHRDLVQDIKSIRAEYVNKSDEIYYFKRHGTLPEQTIETLDVGSEYTASLPRDKFELHKKRKSLESSLSKFKSRLKSSKSEAAQKGQLKNIAEAGLKINIIDQLMATL